MTMKIISGLARGVVLSEVPDTGKVRPTSGRAREALFNALGSPAELTVADLCAGSGALGLEAASRGAARVVLIENDRRQLKLIEENIAKLSNCKVATKFLVRNGDILKQDYCSLPQPDWIFADPPYLLSAEYFLELLSNENFRRWAAGSRLIWELPDTPGEAGKFLNHPALDGSMRQLGGTRFLLAQVLI